LSPQIAQQFTDACVSLRRLAEAPRPGESYVAAKHAKVRSVFKCARAAANAAACRECRHECKAARALRTRNSASRHAHRYVYRRLYYPSKGVWVSPPRGATPARHLSRLNADTPTTVCHARKQRRYFRVGSVELTEEQCRTRAAAVWSCNIDANAAPKRYEIYRKCSAAYQSKARPRRASARQTRAVCLCRVDSGARRQTRRSVKKKKKTGMRGKANTSNGTRGDERSVQ